MELFTTIGKVERAEIQYEPNGRSKGTGVVQFDTLENAETAIGTLVLFVADPTTSFLPLAAANFFAAKFSGYQYGGRPLGLAYVKYLNAGHDDAMQGSEGAAGLTQDQIM